MSGQIFTNPRVPAPLNEASNFEKMGCIQANEMAFFEQERLKDIKAADPLSSDIPNPINGDVDVLIVVFYYLMEAANTSSKTALIHSEQLQQNAKAQQILNDQVAQQKWVDVPSDNVFQWVRDHVPGYENASDWTIQVLYLDMQPGLEQHIKNLMAPQLRNVEAANQEVAAIRETFEDRLTTLQQEAQIGAAKVNTLTDDFTQTLQMGTGLLQMLQSLTFKALLRQPVGG